jgi:hypothetical protein
VAPPRRTLGQGEAVVNGHLERVSRDLGPAAKRASEMVPSVTSTLLRPANPDNVEARLREMPRLRREATVAGEDSARRAVSERA